MSICCLSCCAAVHKLAFHGRPAIAPKEPRSPSTPALPTKLPSINYPPLIYTRLNPQWPPSVTKRLLPGPLNGPCMTLGPLCLIRCYNQTTKGLPLRDSTLHLSLSNSARRDKNPSMGTMRDSSLSPKLVNYVKHCYEEM